MVGVRLQYSENDMEQAIEACKNGMPHKTASTRFGVPRTTLLDKLYSRTKEGRFIGRPTNLTREEELELVNWITSDLKNGCPVKKSDLLNTVQTMIQENPGRKTDFVNGRPGDKWLTGFMKRNPSVCFRIPEKVSKARAAVTEDFIRKWFEDLRIRIEAENALDIFEDPKRIYNCDETNIQLCPKTGRVLGIKGWRNVYEKAYGEERTTLTFLGTFNAAGETVVPFIVYPYLRIPADIIHSVPEDFEVGASDSGWMKSGTFYEFISNSFIPMLHKKKVKVPVILFVDGHSTHLTLQTKNKCQEKGVLLCKLPPNTTHILQSADVGCFGPLKKYWATSVRDFHRQTKTYITKKHVAPILKNALAMVTKETIQKSFETCGLYPFNPNRPNYSKLIPQLRNTEEDTHFEPSVEECRLMLKTMNSILKDRMSKLLEFNVENSYSQLHSFWLTLQRKINENCSGVESSDQQYRPPDLENPSRSDLTLHATNLITGTNEIIDDVADDTIQDNILTTNRFDIKNEKEVAPNILDENDLDYEDFVFEEPSWVQTEITEVNETSFYDENLDQSRSTPGNSGEFDVPCSSVFHDHDFWTGERSYKKRKPPKELLPGCVNIGLYKDYYKKRKNSDKEKTRKKQRKERGDDWICLYCRASWYEEDLQQLGSKWINCDSCPNQMHISCIPEEHRNITKLINDEVNVRDFECEECFVPV